MDFNCQLSDNQKEFIKFQCKLWTASKHDIDLPIEYASIILGLSEANMPFTDCRGNKDFQHNPLFWSGHILEPVINTWLTEQVKQKKIINTDLGSYPLWPDNKKFAVCLTHDVDLINSYSWRAPAWRLKRRYGSLKGKFWDKSCLIDLGKLAYLRARSLIGPQRITSFEPWMGLEDKYGFRSTFFFFPDEASNYHLRDGRWYRHQDMLEFEGHRIMLRDFMRELESRGWEVGLHGTYTSYDNWEELQKQKNQIERSVGSQIVSVRQHHLHFDITKTPLAQSKAGFKFDSTLGFNRIIGFRNGIAFPFFLYDLLNDKPLPLLEIPLHIQDGALILSNNMDLAPELALLHAKLFIDKIEENRGLVTILWHPNILFDCFYIKLFWVYEQLLKYISTKDAWVAPVKEVGLWWESRRQCLSK